MTAPHNPRRPVRPFSARPQERADEPLTVLPAAAPPAKARGRMLPWILGAAALGILICGGAMGGGLLLILATGRSARSVARIGEKVAFRDSHWIVLHAENKGSRLQTNSVFAKEARTDGKFVLVHYAVTNLGGKQETLIETPKLVDSQGREFSQYTNQAFYIPQGGTTIALAALPPSLKKEFYAIYEVPANAAQLQFQARELRAFGEEKLIDLGF